MNFKQTTITSFELYLTETESQQADAVAAAACVGVPELLGALLDSSLNESYEGLMHMHDHHADVELDGDGNIIPGVDDYGNN